MDTPTPPKDYCSPKDDYKEVMASLRHYSTLRFAMMTVFFAATAGLISAAFGKSTDLPALAAMLIKLIGVILALAFLWLEFTLKSYMEQIGAVANELKPQGHWNRLPTKLRSRVHWPLYGIYLLVILFWCGALIPESWLPAAGKPETEPVCLSTPLTPTR